MKLTVKRVQSETIELPDFPFYVKNEGDYIACISKNCMINICDGSIHKYDNLLLSCFSEGFEFITVDEFNVALLSAFENIKNKVNA